MSETFFAAKAETKISYIERSLIPGEMVFVPYLDVYDSHMYYEDIGIGEPILFLHSSYSRGIIAFCGQIQPFFHSYRCLLPDFRGHGRTTSKNKTWDTQIIAQDMAGFLQNLGIRQTHLIGYSLGGGVALHLAARHPDIVKTVITIGCGGVADPTGADEYEPEALLQRGQTEFIELIKTLHADAHGGNWQDHLRQSARDWRNYPCLSPEDWRRLHMPILFIGGENDPFASQRRLLDMQAKCPQAEIYVVPGCGHRPHMPSESAKQVNERIADFLHNVDEKL